VQVGAWKRLGKRSATGTSESGNKSARGVHSSGVGERMVATGAVTMGDRRGVARIFSRATCR